MCTYVFVDLLLSLDMFYVVVLCPEIVNCVICAQFAFGD